MSQFNGDQTHHVNAFNSVQFFFTENKNVYSKNVAFNKWVERLAANNAKIDALSTIKGTTSKGATEEKVDLKLIIAQNAGYVCSYAADYAVEEGDSELYNIVNHTTAGIYKLRDVEIIGFISGITGAVTPLLSTPGFETYPVTAENLEQLTSQATTFNTNLGKNKNITNNSSIASPISMHSLKTTASSSFASIS